MTESFTVRVPASTSNVGSGFDTLSAAMSLHLRIRVTPTEDRRITWVEGWDGPPEDNVVDLALRKALKFIDFRPRGLALAMDNPIPLCRGLGSSGAAIIAGIKIAEKVSGCALTQEQVFKLAYPLEGHPDNLAASFLGGWAISWVESGVMKAERLPATLACRFVVGIPDDPVSTRDARGILPAHYSREDAVFNLQRCALLVHALHAGKKQLLREAIRDRLHQPYRSELVPGIEALLQLDGIGRQIEGHILGIAISGSGSAVLAYADGCCDAVGTWIVDTFRKHGVSSRYVVLDLDPSGATVLLP